MGVFSLSRSLVVKGTAMPTNIMRDEVQRLIGEENAQLVEVLPPAEYEEEHIAGAISIPLRKLDRESTGALDPGRTFADRNVL